MATQPEPKRLYPLDEYFALEAASETKHEYYAGEIFAFAGASFEHNLIAGNLFAELKAALRGSGCTPLTSDMRVRTPSGLYTYPDIAVVCGKPELIREPLDTLVNPTVIAEVLSDSTKDYDRGMRFVRYRSIPSLRSYVVVEQHRIRVEHYRKLESGEWILRDLEGADARLRFESIPFEIRIGDLYDGVTFESATAAST